MAGKSFVRNRAWDMLLAKKQGIIVYTVLSSEISELSASRYPIFIVDRSLFRVEGQALHNEFLFEIH